MMGMRNNTMRFIRHAMVALLITSGAARGQIAGGPQSPSVATPLHSEPGIVHLSSSDCPYIARVCALIADPAVRNYIGLSEYAWDFNAPGGVPGFEAMPARSFEPLIALQNVP